MIRILTLCSITASFLAGCCCSPQQTLRFVPASSVVRVEPSPTTRREFQAAEQQGYLVAATGRGVATGVWDQPVRMYAGQALHVLSVDPGSGEVLACRRDDGTLVRLSSDGLDVETTTYVKR